MTIPFQAIRGIYERIIIDAASPVSVYVENQSAVSFDALQEYCFARVNFGKMQDGVIGAPAQWNVRGSLVCEIYTRKGSGPGRGLQIAGPIIDALVQLNAPAPSLSEPIIARVGILTGPTQAELEERPHHFTRFSMPFQARSRLVPS